MEEKRCPRCGETKTASMFSKNKAARDGLQIYCKACTKAVNADYVERNPERVRALAAARAKKWRDSNPDAFKASIKRYVDANPEKVKQWKASWIQANKERHLESKRNNSRKRYFEAPELAKARHQKWRERNLEHAREVDCVKAMRWAIRHPECVNELTSRRRAAVKSAAPAWREKALIETVYAKARAFGFHVDHVVPLNSRLVSGLHVWHNLQLLDSSINCAKRNRSWPDMP